MASPPPASPPPARKPSPPDADFRAEIVEKLEGLLRDARAGLIEGIALVADYEDRFETVWSGVGPTDARDMIALLDATIAETEKAERIADATFAARRMIYGDDEAILAS